MQPPLRFRRILAGLVSLACAGCQTAHYDLYGAQVRGLKGVDSRELTCDQLQLDAGNLRREMDRLATLFPGATHPGEVALALAVLLTCPINPGCWLLVPPYLISWNIEKAINLDEYQQRLANHQVAMREIGCPDERPSTATIRGGAPTQSATAETTTSLAVAPASGAAPVARFDGPALESRVANRAVRDTASLGWRRGQARRVRRRQRRVLRARRDGERRGTVQGRARGHHSRPVHAAELRDAARRRIE